MITVENLSKSFWGNTGPVVAIDDVTLDVPTGTITGVVGPSGSGKSTLARLVALQERPDSGVIRVDGFNTAALDPRRLRAARRRIGVVTQGDLLPQRTAAGNIALPLEQAGVDGPQRREKVGKLLDLIGLTDKAARYPDTLTDGQRARVEVARALVGDPGLLLADDPTRSLDSDGAAGVLTVLDRARAELGATVLVVTSDAGVVRRIADDVVLLEDGKVTESGNLLSLVQDSASQVARTLLPSIDVPKGATAGYDRVAEVVLIGFAAVGALLPEATARFGSTISVIGGGLTRVGETPVARFLLGVNGGWADQSLTWIAERGGVVRPQVGLARTVAA
ncbi:methionine ABC transporter ATP-binding protein [Actinokineospora globicatena]|uniref:Methionine import ATP-binding protein MetN n=1 Tax=Actinokineospora globicatena TaxID=103729 RepID=A0A9W6VBC7_9PSEU|nr:ATP-binding cassette domain-containing protein [Actinokineospora globicatena]MCP2300648.1 D-methionine transport system ATP-binding protein [Actinokineospora globicatena]GLW81192.1 methionine import ATP-binding protein MetN [Actinokineospora globicatena]GLW88385.1 methionine import ATP-binding protein MetN [Actinokineospora globicatena]GLW92853.1 methionine import ATP-binding protein MetN [Actinokineospora globicatena]